MTVAHSVLVSAAVKGLASTPHSAGGLDTAEALALALLADCPSSLAADQAEVRVFANGVGELPPRMRSYYAKALLDWAIIRLCKDLQSDAGTQPGLVGQNGPRCWRLLATLLRIPGIKGWTMPAGPLYGAATAACKAGKHNQFAGELAKAILDALRLSDAFIDGSQPAIEQGVALAVAAIEVASCDVSQLCEDWGSLVAHVLVSLRRCCLENHNYRKGFSAVVGHLLVPILQSAFRESARPSHVVGSMEAVGLHLIDSVIFHSSHLQGLAELMSREALRWYTSGLKPNGMDKGMEGMRSYHWQLHEVWTNAIASGRAETALAVARAGPWLLQRFAAAVTRHRRTAASDLNATLAPKSMSYDTANEPGGIARSASFHFFSMLAQPLLAQLGDKGYAAYHAPASPVLSASQQDEGSRKQKGKRKLMEAEGSVQPSTKKHKATAEEERSKDCHGKSRAWVAEGMAALVGALKELGMYQVTEDVDGAHQKLLAQIGAVALTASCADDKDISIPPGERTLAAVKLIGALMDVEHRVLQPYLVQLWTLIWDAAEYEPGGTIAARVASKLVAAYAELRQLEVLIASLQQALNPSCSKGAAIVICSPTFQASLQTALAELPPGQAQAILCCVDRGISTLLASSGASLDALGSLYTSCLDRLQVRLPTSASLASSVQALIENSLAGPLGSLLQRVADECALLEQETQVLAVLLSIYVRLLQVHSECAALQPQISPLAGQSTGGMHPQDSGFASIQDGGFFEAIGSQSSLLLIAEQTMASIAALLAVRAPSQSVRATAGVLRTALMECGLQRMATLHERITRLRYSCAIPAIDEEDNHDAHEVAVREGAKVAVSVKEARDLSILLLRLSGPTDETQHPSPQLQASDRQIWLLCASQAGLLLRWSRREAAIPFVQQIVHKAAQESASYAVRQSDPTCSNPAGTSVSNPSSDTGWQWHHHLLEQLASESGEIFQNAFPTAICLSIAQGLQHASLLGEQEAKPSRSGANTSRAALDQLASLVHESMQISSQLVRDSEHTLSTCDLAQLLTTFMASQQDAPEAPRECDASSLVELTEADEMSWNFSSTGLHQLSLLLTLLASGCICQLNREASAYLVAQLVLCLMTLLAAINLQYSSAGPGKSTKGGRHREHNSSVALFVAVKATLQALMMTFAIGTEDAVRTLAGLGPPALALLGVAGRRCCKLAHGKADISLAMEQVLELIASLQQRLFAYHLGIRSSQAPADEESAPLSDDHTAAWQIAEDSHRQAEAVAGAVANGTGALVSCQSALSMQAFAAAVLQAWNALEKRSKKVASGIVTGPPVLIHHKVDLDTLASCTLALERAVSRALCLHHSISAFRPTSAPDVKLLTLSMAALLGASGHLLDVRHTAATSQAMQGPSPLASGLASLLAAAHEILGWAIQHPTTNLADQCMAAEEDSFSTIVQCEPAQDTEYGIWQTDVRGGRATNRKVEGGKAGGVAGEVKKWQVPPAAIVSIINLLAAAARELQHKQVEGACLDGEFYRLISLHYQMLQNIIPLQKAAPALQANSGTAVTTTLRSSLLSSMRQTVEAATLPQVRHLLEYLRERICCVSSADEALPYLEMLLEVLECGGSPVKQRVKCQEALIAIPIIFTFVQQFPLHSSPENPAFDVHDFAGAAAPIQVALRCLESMAGRPGMFELAPRHIADCLQTPISCFSGGACGRPVSRDIATRVAAVFIQACKLLVAILRHHGQHARRCMALLALSARNLLKMLLAIAPVDTQLAAACAQEVANVYAALADQKEAVSMYCVHLLAEYLVLMVAPSSEQAAVAAIADCSSQAGSSELPLEAAAILRRGAYALYGACSAAEVQHIFAALSGSAGSTRRLAIASLRKDYQAHYKHTGKV